VRIAENNIERFIADRVRCHGRLRLKNDDQTASTAVTSGT